MGMLDDLYHDMDLEDDNTIEKERREINSYAYVVHPFGLINDRATQSLAQLAVFPLSLSTSYN